MIKIHELSLKMKNESQIIKNIDTWTTSFIKYTKKGLHVDVLNEKMSDEKFKEYLSKFLWSANGARYQKNFRFDKELICGEPTPNITVNIYFFF